MENIKRYFLIKTNRYRYLELLIFIGLSVLVCTISDVYSFNPFILVVIFLAYSRGINTYLLSVASTIVTAFIIGIPYGIELSLVNLMFFIFCLLFCFVGFDNTIKKYGPFFLTHIFFIVIFLIRYFSFDNVLNILISFTASCLLLYGYNNLLKCIYENNNEFDGRAKVIVLASFSLIFYGLSGFYILITRYIHILICKTSNTLVGALALILNCVIVYYLQNASGNMLLLLLFPSLIAVVFNKKLTWIIYLISYVFISIYALDKFYTSIYFYQGLLGILLALITPNKVIDYLTSLFTKEESKQMLEINDKLNSTTTTVANIIDYLDIVLDASMEIKSSPEEKTLAIIEGKVCNECIRKDKCTLFTLLRKGLEEDLTKEDRLRLFDECLFPYKIIRQLRINKTTLANEKKYLNEIINKHNIYKQEIENIYRPLRNVFSTSALMYRKKNMLLQELESANYHVIELNINDFEINLLIALEHKEDISKVLVLISNNLKTTYYLENMFYILSLGAYEVKISCLPLFKVEEGIASYGVNQEFNGDTYKISTVNNHYNLILSDGIGHNEESAYLSFFLVNALSSFAKIEENKCLQIKNINALLKSKINVDMYGTLDYIDLDLVKGTLNFYKCGSFNSYLYRHQTLFKYKSVTPPLGILYEIKAEPLVKELQDQDILILMSDGYMDEPEKIINEVLKDNYQNSASKIVNVLDQKLANASQINDDKTLIVLKLINIRSFEIEKA